MAASHSSSSRALARGGAYVEESNMAIGGGLGRTSSRSYCSEAREA
jgi:hypothetical protein